jgi:hypothetical protein
MSVVNFDFFLILVEMAPHIPTVCLILFEDWRRSAKRQCACYPRWGYIRSTTCSKVGDDRIVSLSLIIDHLKLLPNEERVDSSISKCYLLPFERGSSEVVYTWARLISIVFYCLLCILSSLLFSGAGFLPFPFFLVKKMAVRPHSMRYHALTCIRCRMNSDLHFVGR